MKFHAKAEDEIHLIQGYNSLKGKAQMLTFLWQTILRVKNETMKCEFDLTANLLNRRKSFFCGSYRKYIIDIIDII